MPGVLGRDGVQGGDRRQPVELPGGDAEGQVEVARFELGDGERGIGEELEDDLLDLRGALEVVGVGFQLDRLVGREAGELVGSGPDRDTGLADREVDRLDVGLGHVLEDVLRQDHVGHVGEAVEEPGVRGGERELDRRVIDLLEALGRVRRPGDRLGALDLVPVRQEALEGIPVLECPVDREHDVVGVEGLSVVPLRVVHEVERVDRGVRRDVERRGEVADDRLRIRLCFDQGVEDVAEPLELVAGLELDRVPEVVVVGQARDAQDRFSACRAWRRGPRRSGRGRRCRGRRRSRRGRGRAPAGADDQRDRHPDRW